MKLALLFALALSASAAEIACFKVGKMTKALWEGSDTKRFYVEAVSRCPKYLEEVYVRIQFVMPDGTCVNSFWERFGVYPNQAIRNEFAYTPTAKGFVRIQLRDVVTTIQEAMK